MAEVVHRLFAFSLQLHVVALALHVEGSPRQLRVTDVTDGDCESNDPEPSQMELVTFAEIP